MNGAPDRGAVASSKIGDVVDFNVHDLVGIRLVNPSPRDVQVVESHLGLEPSKFSGNPALTISFVDRLAIDQPLRFLGRDDVAFTDDDFIVLRSRNLARARSKLAMEKIGATCELVCETGLPAIPLLRQLLNLVMLARGVVPVHATGFRHRGRGVMVTGWSHGSKTGSLLSFMAAGAKFIGDEWIYLSAERERMYGLPDQLEARPWYLRELPQYQRHVNFTERTRTGLAAGLARMLCPLVARSEKSNSLGSKIIRHAHDALLDQQAIHLWPRTLFGADSCILVSPLDIVIVAVSQEAEEVRVAQAPIEQAVGQMAASFLHEHASLFACYHKYLFAFPSRRNALLDQAEQIYRRCAVEALEGRRAYTMLHPYPVSIGALQKAIEPLLSPE